jgi:hypothetical protein
MTTVVHCRKEKYDVLIVRGTKWGNPFPIPPYSREESLTLYEQWIQTQYHLLKDIIKELKGKRLGCWCKPKYACHGDVLAYLADNL